MIFYLSLHFAQLKNAAAVSDVKLAAVGSTPRGCAHSSRFREDAAVSGTEYGCVPGQADGGYKARQSDKLASTAPNVVIFCVVNFPIHDAAAERRRRTTIGHSARSVTL